jgi:hypothetical protein
MLMLLIVFVRVQDSRCMGLRSISWDILIPASVRLLVVILVVIWPVVSNVPIHDGSLDMCMFCLLHVLCIYDIFKLGSNKREAVAWLVARL